MDKENVKTKLLSLKDLLNEIDEEEVVNILASFKCEKNEDVDSFLKNKSIRFEKADRSRTYFIIDYISFTKGKIAILAYFTIAMKKVDLGSDISKNMRKELDGISKEASYFNCYLIGQLAKNDYYTDFIKGKDIIKYSEETILEVYKIIGGRIILIECENLEALKKLYFSNDYKFLQIDEKSNLIQLYKPIKSLNYSPQIAPSALSMNINS